MATSKAESTSDKAESKSYVVTTPQNPGYNGLLGKVQFTNGEAVVPAEFERELAYVRSNPGYEVADNSGPNAKPVPDVPEVGTVKVTPATLDNVVQPLIPIEGELPSPVRRTAAKAPVKVATVEVDPGKDHDGKPAESKDSK